MEYGYELYYRKKGSNCWNKLQCANIDYAMCTPERMIAQIKENPVGRNTEDNMGQLYQHFYTLARTGNLRYKNNTKLEVSLDKLNIYTITINKKVSIEVGIDSYDMPGVMAYEKIHGDLIVPKKK